MKVDLPDLPSTLPVTSQRGARAAPRGGRTLFCVPIAALTSKQRWGRRQRDTSLQEEEERARLGEERRRRHQNVLDRRKAHARLGLDKTEGSRDTPHYDDCE